MEYGRNFENSPIFDETQDDCWALRLVLASELESVLVRQRRVSLSEGETVTVLCERRP